MEVSRHYSNLTERQAVIKEQESQGLTMLYDTFDQDWRSGDEPHGEMVFTDYCPVLITEPKSPRDLEAEIDAIKIRLDLLSSGPGSV